MTYKDFTEIIRGSKRYEMDGTLLTVTGYCTGKRVTIDLGAIDSEMFETLAYEPEDTEEEDW